MLPLRPFHIVSPKNLDDLLCTLASADKHSKMLAGGTDLLPNLKHGLYDVDKLISLKRVDELNKFEINRSELIIGASVKLDDIASNNDIKRLLPALIKASSQIASPQIRNMGTVGGNICLDTRCLYINQSEFWRKALGYCLKKDGNGCHVIKTGKRCVAAASNDLATVLLAYDAEITICSLGEKLAVKLDAFYTANGEKNNILLENQVVTQVKIDLSSHAHGGFFKLRHRQSIDFPMLSTAVYFLLEDGNFLTGRLVVNALVSKPKVIDLSGLKGCKYNNDLIADIASLAEKKCFPQTNICDDVSWRKKMVSYCVKMAFLDAQTFAD